MELCLSPMASLKRWLHGVEALQGMIWSMAEPYFLRFGAVFSLNLNILDYPAHPFCAPNIKIHPSISDWALFELIGIHKKMIVRCRSTSGHDLVHCRYIFPQICEAVFSLNLNISGYPSQSFRTPNIKWHHLPIPDGALFESISGYQSFLQDRDQEGILNMFRLK